MATIRQSERGGANRKSPRAVESKGKYTKKATPKGGGKAASSEKMYTKVSQATIDKIKTMGMTKALASAGKTKPGQRAEFIQGIRRMYGADRLAAARKSANTQPGKVSPRAAERGTTKVSPRAAERATKPGMLNAGPKAKVATVAKAKSGMTKPPSSKLPYYYTQAEKAYVQKYGKSTKAKTPRTLTAREKAGEAGMRRGR
jgi:hypothetical protein